MTFLASLYKDLRLFLTRSGILALILPLLLLPALILGVDDLTSSASLPAFPVAVRDEDDTVMSHSLLTQLADIELFSEVRVLDDETDAEAIAAGAVAVATIPKDFFYDLYTMSDCPVSVTLNSARPTEAAVFSAIFRSVMSIIRTNHSAALGTYTFVYGDLTPELTSRMRSETGDRLVYDALGRQRVFSDLLESSDLPAALTRRLCACVLGVLALFYALGSAKTVPEERRLGVLPRLRASGASTVPFALSKLLTALLLSLPTVILVKFALKTPFFELFALYCALLLAAFGLMSAISLASNSAAGAQRAGNIVLLVSIALGGTLFPVSALPDFLRPLSGLTVPNCALVALEAANAGLSAADTLPLLWPLPVLTVLPALATPLAALLRRAKSKLALSRRPSPRPTASPDGPLPAAVPAKSPALRTLRLTLFRLRQSTGGPAALCATLAAALICGACAASLTVSAPTALRLCVWDRDGTDLSNELSRSIADSEGVDAVTVSGPTARRALITGEREALVVIGEGYSAALTSGAPTPLTVETSSSSVSGQAARELVAGAVLAQLRMSDAEAEAAALLGRELTEADKASLRAAITDAAGTLPELYHIAYTSGSAPADPFSPRPMSFACLAALFTLLTAASFTSTPGGRAASRRLKSIPGGAVSDMLASIMSLTALGFAVTLCVLIPAKAGLSQYPAALMASLTLACLSLTLTTLTSAEGRVDTLAPLAALLICILGGSFMDLTAITPALRPLTWLSPASLAALPLKYSLPSLLLYSAILSLPLFPHSKKSGRK